MRTLETICYELKRATDDVICEWYCRKYHMIPRYDESFANYINYFYIDGAFVDDVEKMVDFNELTKDEFLSSYSYITEREYDATLNLVHLLNKGGN